MWKSHCQLLGRGDPVSKSHGNLSFLECCCEPSCERQADAILPKEFHQQFELHSVVRIFQIDRYGCVHAQHFTLCTHRGYWLVHSLQARRCSLFIHYRHGATLCIFITGTALHTVNCLQARRYTLFIHYRHGATLCTSTTGTALLCTFTTGTGLHSVHSIQARRYTL